MLHGFPTPDGTRRFASCFPSLRDCGFYRLIYDLEISSLGMGSYLGEQTAEVDAGYEQTAVSALRSGINFFDTAINYRHQRSERALGSAFRQMLNANELQRDQFMVCTKAGFLTKGAVPENLAEEDTAGGKHSMHPDFLEDQLNRSRSNLDLDTIDVFYLHNPETQLRFMHRSDFDHRLQLAFERCERLVSERRIRWYGTATWDGFRNPDQLQINHVIDLARYVGGEDHHFRFIQLPFNFGMIEAYSHRDPQGVSVLKAAERAGITVVASASLHQGRFTRTLPDVIANRIPGLRSAAARALHFVRSTPGIAVALAGMSSQEHLTENLKVGEFPPMGISDYEKLYRPVEE